MSKGMYRALLEIALIFFSAAVIGVAWNHALLLSAWRGEAVPAPPSAASPAPAGPAAGQKGEEEIPLPLGLMQVKEMYDAKEAVIIDARDVETFAGGHLKGALSLPLKEAVKGIPAGFKDKVPVQRELIVYCNGFSCHDSMELGKLLLKWGYRTVYVYEGGFPEWQDAGYPVERGNK